MGAVPGPVFDYFLATLGKAPQGSGSQRERFETPRRGRKRAVVALGHTLLVIVYHVLRRGGEYQELGAGYREALASDRLTANWPVARRSWATR